MGECLSRRVTVLSLFAATALAQAQSAGVAISGTLESYFTASATTRGAQHRITWMQVVADVNPRLRLVAGNQQRINANSLDESYVEVNDGHSTMVRAGVMRSAFGFSDWAEQYYNGIISLPFVRLSGLYDGFNLTRLDSGVQVTAGSPALQFQVGQIDADRESRQFFPKRMDHTVARLQTCKGAFIFGVSGLQMTTASDPDHIKVYGMDLRWTAPQIQFRAEADRADSVDGTSEGYYADLFYRLPRSTSTRFAVRAESFLANGGGPAATHFVLGLRQVFNENFTFSLNYGIGNHVSPAVRNRGWSAQLMTSVHF